MITGATSGIGWETALRFAELKTQCVLIGRRNQKLIELQQEIKQRFLSTPIPETVKLDICDIEAVKTLPGILRHKNVDILINCAGLALGVNNA